jgi:predicted metalloprotease
MPRTAVAGGGIGIVGIILLLVLSGGDVGKVLDAVVQQGGPAGGQQNAPADPREQEWAEMAGVVLRDTEVVWTNLLPKLPGRMRTQYREPTLVLFTQATESACGFAGAATGPFYCPPDEKVYIDLSFFREMEQRFNAPGDFAYAYVIAHEVGHHVQKVLGITDQVHSQRQSLSQEEYNKLSVRLELQADFLAGVWAHHAERNWKILEAGDLQEAINAAEAIGDDRLQRQSQGYVVPESFTHGSSQQRMRWLSRGLETGNAAEMTLLFEVDERQL